MGYRPVGRVDALLEDLCTTHGVCLREEDRQALIAVGPQDRDAIVDAIIRAEFGQAASDDEVRRTWLLSIVDAWLFDRGGRGARSGLP